MVICFIAHWPSLRTTPLLSLAIYSTCLQLSPYLKAVFTIYSLRTHHMKVTRDPLSVMNQKASVCLEKACGTSKIYSNIAQVMAQQELIELIQCKWIVIFVSVFQMQLSFSKRSQVNVSWRIDHFSTVPCAGDSLTHWQRRAKWKIWNRCLIHLSNMNTLKQTMCYLVPWLKFTLWGK